MKKQLILIVLSSLPLLNFSQISYKIDIANEKVSLVKGEKSLTETDSVVIEFSGKVVYSNKIVNNKLKNTDLVIQFTNWDNKLDTINVDTNSNSIVFLYDEKQLSVKIFICDKYFSTTSCPNKPKKQEKPVEDAVAEYLNNKYFSLYSIPAPIFSYSKKGLTIQNSSNNSGRLNRALIIDCSPNPAINEGNRLVKISLDSVNRLKIKYSNSIPINTTVKVFLKNFQMNKVSLLSISINNEDYGYTETINSLNFSGFNEAAATSPSVPSTETKSSESASNIDKIKQEIINEIGGVEAVSAIFGYEEKLKDEIKKQINDWVKNYFDSIYNYLSKNEFLNINDVMTVEQYKTDLKSFVTDTSNKVVLNKNNFIAYSKILNWHPTFVLLNPLGNISNSSDQLNIRLSMKTKHYNITNKPIGRYRLKGGFSPSLMTSLFVTNLTQPEIYKDSIDCGNGSKELRLVQKRDKVSLGLGMKFDLQYRTGTAINPLGSIGFFLPFDQEFMPILNAGGGVSLSNKRARLSCSFGLAAAQIKEISDQYKDKDISQFTLVTDYTQKRWDLGWQFAIGFKYNLISN